MPNLKTEVIGGGDKSWLGSDHGIFNNRTGTLDVSLFTKATHFPNGYFPSGLPVNVANEGAVGPWSGAAGQKLGFLFDDMTVDANITNQKIPAAIVRHGIIKTARLPIAFTVPVTLAAGAAADGSAAFTFVTEAGA